MKLISEIYQLLKIIVGEYNNMSQKSNIFITCGCGNEVELKW